MTTPSQAFLLLLLSFVAAWESSVSVEILSKSKIEKCQKMSGSDTLDCNKKIVVNMAVPSESSGREAFIVAELVEAEEENAARQMKTIRTPPVITVQKSAAYALYELTYIRVRADVPYKPVEHFVRTRKCRPDSTANVLKICESQFVVLVDRGGVHLLHVGISEVVVGPENRTVLSSDNFLRVHLIGDFVGYTNLPTFEEFYLVIPRQEGPGQPQNLGNHFSKWMLLERVRFTLDGLECNKIGVGYEAFNAQPNFCSSPLESCLQSQLWKLWDDRINKKLMPQYVVEGRFERINQHPDAGTHSFSIGITEVLSTNLLLELSADDIDYVYQRSPGKVVSVTTPTFEALTQFGTATIMAKNTGKLEASYSLTEQFFILKPQEVTSRSFKVYATTDLVAKYVCEAILKDSDFKEIDRAECQFATTATIFDNGTQKGFFDPIHDWWEERFQGSTQRAGIDQKHGKMIRQPCTSLRHTQHDGRHYGYDTRSKRRSSHPKHDHRHHHHHHHSHHEHKYSHRHRCTSDSMDEKLEHSIHKVQKVAMKRQTKRSKALQMNKC
ncbi:hypothetical protein ACLOJK_016036 [Asimina triloba]